MAFKKKASLDADTTIKLGGINKETKKPNPKSVEGYYLGNRTVETKFGPGKIHFFQTEKGNVGVWGTTDIDRKLSSNDNGVMTRVTHTGSKPSKKGNDMLTYEVETDADNTIEVDAGDMNLGSDEDDGDGGYEGAQDEYNEGDVGEEEAYVEEAPPSRPAAPKRAAQAPSSAQQAKVQALLKGRTAGAGARK